MVSRHNRYLLKVQAELSSDFELQSQIFLRSEQALKHLENQKIDAFVLCFEMMGMPQVQIVKTLLEIYPNLPIVVLSNNFGPSARRVLMGYSKVFLKNFTQLEEMPGIVKKMLRNKKVKERAYLRYQVETLISVNGNGVYKTGRALDISSGGLRARAFDSNIREGDLVQLEFSTSSGLSCRQVQGRVIWVRSENNTEPRSMRSQTLGIQFMN